MNIDEIGNPVFYCVDDTPNIIIGDLLFKVLWLEDKKVKSTKVTSIKTVVDEFGDKLYNISVVSPLKIQVKLLYFEKSKIEHGFSYLECYGNGLDDFFSNSWVWSSTQSEFLNYDLVKDELENKILFPGKVYDGVNFNESAPIEMVIHKPSKNLLSGFSKGKLYNLQKIPSLGLLLNNHKELSKSELIENLLVLTEYCEFVSIWLHGPDRPILLSKNIQLILDSISDFCDKYSIKFKNIDSEEKLPVL